MKYLLNLVLIMAISSCQKSQDEAIHISIIYDTTEPMDIPLNATDIINLFCVSDNKWKSVSLRIVQLNEAQPTVHEFSIPASSSFRTTDHKRNQQLRSFIHEMEQTIDNLPVSETKQYSTIYPHIVNEMLWLNQLHPTTQKYCYILSDLRENAKINAYKKQTKELIAKQPKELAQQLQSMHGEIPKATPCSIHLVYQPKNGKDALDQNYWNQLYTDYLFPQGSDINSTTNIPNNNCKN